jgi:hypothetical protein
MDQDTQLLSLPPDIEVVVAIGDQLITARSGQRIPRESRFFGIRRIKAVIPIDEEIRRKKIDLNYGAAVFHIGAAGLSFHILGWIGVIAWGLVTLLATAIWNASVREANLRKFSTTSSTSGRAPNATP